MTQADAEDTMAQVFGITSTKRSTGPFAPHEFAGRKSGDDFHSIFSEVRKSASQSSSLSQPSGNESKQRSLFDILGTKKSVASETAPADAVAPFSSTLRRSNSMPFGAPSGPSQSGLSFEKEIFRSKTIGLSSLDVEKVATADERASGGNGAFLVVVAGASHTIILKLIFLMFLLLDELKSKLPAESYLAFKKAVSNTAKSSGPILSQLSQIRQFVDHLHSILSRHLRPQAILDIFSRLTPLVPTKHQSIYESISRKLCQSASVIPSSAAATPIESDDRSGALAYSQLSQQLSAQPKAVPNGVERGQDRSKMTPDRPKPQSKSSGAASEIENISKRVFSAVDPIDLRSPDSVVINSQPSEFGSAVSKSVLGSSSKRARSMVLGASSNSATPIDSREISVPDAKSRSNPMTLLARIDNIVGGTETAKGKASTQRTSSHAITCPLCNEKSNNPYAAKCGHIICWNCWVNWLKLKQSCPICRKEVSLTALTGIVVKICS
jgi:hypothetical protein